jgi:hypothetical protein
MKKQIFLLIVLMVSTMGVGFAGTYNDTICKGDSILIGNVYPGATLYQWNTNPPQYSSQITVTPSITTSYIVNVFSGVIWLGTDTFNVFVKPKPYVAISSTSGGMICLGANTTLIAQTNPNPLDSYQWSTGHTTDNITVNPSVNTNYFVTVTSNGCTNNASFNLNVQSPPIAYNITGNTTYCPQDFGVVIGLDGSENDSWYKLLRNGLWVGTAVGTGAPISFGMIANANGTYTVTGEKINLGCSSPMNGVLQVTPSPLPNPVLTILGPGTLCQNTVATFMADPVMYATSYFWSVPMGATILSGQGTNQVTVSFGMAGTGQVSVHGINACGNGPQFSKNVTVQPIPNITIIGNTSICHGQSSFLLAVGSATSYQWSTGDTTSGITVSPTSTTTYTVTVTGTGSCIATTSAMVVVNPVPVANATITSGSSSCGGSPVDLLASGGTTYLWSTGQTTATITVTPFIATWYYVTVSNGFGCSDVDSVYVPVNPMPSIMFNLQSDICSDGSPITLAPLATVTPNNGGSIWFTGAGVASNVFYPSTVAVSGTYDITAHYTDPTTGCSSSVTQLITVHHPPTVTFNMSTGTVCTQDAPFVLTGGIPTGGVYSGPGVNSTTGVFSPATAGAGTHQISYTYTDPYGCDDVSSDNVVVNAPASVIMSVPATQMCTGDAPININVSPAGAYVTANGMTLLQTGPNTFQFDPQGLNPGTYTIVATLPSSMCGGSNTQYIEVFASPVVTITGPTTIAIDAIPVQLIISPPGGQLTINGNVSGYWFDPSYWGPGTHYIVYTYSNGICEESASMQITVGTTSVDDINISYLIDLYPNPMSDVLNIKLDNVEVSEFQVFDMMGKILYSSGVSSDHLFVDVSGFAPGMYFVRFFMKDGLVSQPFKVMKQ